ncbi:tail fiber assembly protein [Pseudomonas guariconensis]|uniref:tail fiber assembly protein n=1 Tax=Pseudomonas guariconensis TaxID=1288410 RepID=UPI0022B2AB02|nr:tail fiber assembly protein [Pseudomonas guariconensis]
MIIKLSPAGCDAELSVVKSGDTLIINGVILDFTQLEDGSTLPADAVGSEWVIQTVERIGGDLVVTLTLPHAGDAPESVRFPVDIINPADGPVQLPGLHAGSEQQPSVNGVIDWSRVITQAMKDQAAAEQHLAQVIAEITARRDVADRAIAPLQDAVDLDEATEAELAELKEWKRYRVALNRLPDQPGYPNEITWPVPPA